MKDRVQISSDLKLPYPNRVTEMQDQRPDSVQEMFRPQVQSELPEVFFSRLHRLLSSDCCAEKI